MINGNDQDQHPLARSANRRRVLDVETWAASGVPLLAEPREFVTELHQRHLPQPGTVIVAVLDAQQSVTASASFAPRPHHLDGWQHRNALLAQLRLITPHDLRLARPSRTAVLLRCREGAAGWTEQDGAWMWALRDAAALHGLRCGSYIALTPTGWQTLGDGRSGRDPHAGSWADGPLHTVTELPTRTTRETQPPERPWGPARMAAIEPARRTAAR
ncbi:hypothetical protein [Kitasatospora sp. NPDC050543]|uniref:hypothetical protein n=1 Tax=Kitasatospora sp. NPDC050543 TaxID=3364054 RepID=UPI00378ECB9E